MNSVQAPPSQTCRQCGRALDPSQLGGVCAACLWEWFSDDDAPAPAPSSSERPVLLRLPGYEVLEEIARGGMGIVYRARQLDPAREVALKMLLPQQLGSPEVAQRFDLEARTLAGCEHPAILPIYQSGIHDGMPFFTMKLAAGGTLAQRRDRLVGRWQEIASLLVTVAEAVHFAHERGVLHRDLKPGNILFDEQDRPYVSDFGLAKLVGASPALTRSTDTLGTPHYMAPEVAAGSARQATVASDVYSLGAVLYELLAGRPPFEAEGVPALLKKIVEEEPARPQREAGQGSRTGSNALVPPRDLEVITLKCLAKEPARRYVSARELAQDLRRFLDGEPIQARPMPWLARVIRWGRKQPGLAGLSIALALALLAGLAGVLTQWHRAEVAARIARLQFYASDMQAAHVALSRGDCGFVRQTLAAHRPAPGQEDLRGFEWRLLWTLSRGEQRHLLRGHTGEVAAVAFSPDDRFLASAGADGTVRLWDVTSGAAGTVISADAGGVKSVAYSPDGALLALGGESGVQLWSLAERRVVRSFPGRRTRAIFQPRTSVLAMTESVGDKAWRVVLWNVHTGERVRDWAGTGPRLAFSGDGRLLATAGDGEHDGERIAVWDAGTGGLLKEFSKDRVLTLAFGPDHQTLLASRRHGGIARCNLVTGKVDEPWPGDSGNAAAVAVSPDGRTVAAGCFDNTLRLLSLESRNDPVVRMRGHTSEPHAVAFSADGQWLASGGLDGTVRVWPRSPAASVPRLQNTGAAPRFSPASSWIAYRGGRDMVRIWDIERWQEVTTLPLRQPLGFSADGLAFLGATAGPVEVESWDVASRRLLRSVPLHRERQDLGGINASPDAALVYMREDDGSVGVWETGTGVRRCDIRGAWRETFAARFSPDGRRIAVAVDAGRVVVWDTRQNRQVRDLQAHAAPVRRLDFSGDGRLLASAAEDGLIRIWDTRTWRELGVLSGHRGAVWGVAFAPDGRTLASTSFGQVLLWHVPTGRKLMTLTEEGCDKSVSFCPRGRALVVEMRGNASDVWRAAALAECDAELDALLHGDGAKFANERP